MTPSSQDILALVARHVGSAGPDLDLDCAFVTAGADSLALMALSRQLESECGVRVPVRELFDGAETPRKLVDRLIGAGLAVAGPGSLTGPAPVPPASADHDSVLAVINSQLRFTENMLDTFSRLATEQLRALEVGPPPVQAPAQPPVPAQHHPLAFQPSPGARPAPAPAPASAPASASASASVATQAAPRRTDFSLYFFGDYPDHDAAVDYAHLLDAAVFADEHGFHAVWIPERHFHSFGGLFPNPSVLAASLATRTSRVRLHAGSVVLPLHHPLRVAEEWSVVDNLSGGRVGLGFASGWHARDFVLAPENYDRRREVLYENLDVFRQYWSGRPVQAPSGTGEQVEVTLHPRPVQEDPPLYAAVLSQPESFERAAAADLGVVTNLMVQSVDDLRENIARYRRTRAAHGLDPAAGRVTVLVHTYVDADAERAVREAREPFRRYLRSSLQLFDSLADGLGLDVDLSATSEEDLDFVLDRAYDRYRETRALIGSPDSVGPVLDALIDAGVDEVACFIDFGLDPRLMLDGLPHLDVVRQRCTAGPRPERHAAMPRSARPEPVAASTAGASTPAVSTPAVSTPEARPVPATPLQRRMWLLDRMRSGQHGQHAYHEPKAVLLEGPLDQDALLVALRRTVDRHPQLRTVFREQGGDGPLEQVVLDSVAVDCPVVDLAGLDDGAALERLRDLADGVGFDLAQGPLIRAWLGRFDANRHVLFLVAHHIVFDAMSTPVFLGDVAAFCRAWPGEPGDLTEPGPSRPPKADLDEIARSLGYWRRTLAGAAKPQLPFDRPRPGGAAAVGATVTHALDTELSEQVRAMSRAEGCTLFMSLLGAVGSVLGRFCGQQDVVLGTAVSRRPSEAAQVVGMFVETAPLRLDLSGDPSFREVVHRVRARTSEAIEHLGVPFDQVVEAVNPDREPGVNPLFQVMVEFEGETALDFSGTGLTARLLDVPRNQAPFDLSFFFSERSDGIHCAVEYDTRLFDESTVRRVLEYVEDLLRHVVSDPAEPLSRLPALTHQDRQDLDGRQGVRTEDPPACLHELLEEQARLTPDAVAGTGDGGTLTYGELDAAANRLAHRLAGRGLAPGDRAGVCLPRGRALVVAILAVLKCGAAYVPVDRSLPLERRRFMLADSDVALVVADGSFEDTHAAAPAEDRQTEGLPCPVQDVDDVDPALPTTPLDRKADPEAAAYHIYTSGTSGRPKAVAVPHRGPVNLIRWQLRTLGALRTVQWASVGFDVSVQEIFSTLASGSTLVVLDDEMRYDPTAVAEHLRQYEVERLSIPYTPLKLLAAELASVPSLRQLLAGGERLVITPELRALAEACPQLEIHQHYGPTETSVVVVAHRVDPRAETIPPIGRPVDHVLVRIVDTSGRPVPVGAQGELLVGGPQVALGYFGRPELTRERYVADPLGEAEGAFYRTGDLVRLRSDGLLECLGRIDAQVKIRGHRVEPDEAQCVLAELPEVREAVVLARPDHAGETELAAYVVLEAPVGDGDDWISPLRGRLAAVLPNYLIPQAWTRLDRVPYTVHGKLDRPALLALPGESTGGPLAGLRSPAPDDAADDAADVRERLRKLWSLELGHDPGQVDTDRSFFDLGGNSLSAVRLLERIRVEYDRRVPVAEFFRAPTIRALAGRLHTEGA